MITLLLVVAVVAMTNINLKKRQSRDELRLKHLHTIGLAEEYYYDKYKKYGEMNELYRIAILKEPYEDPVTNRPYEIFLNNLADEWCVWATSEAMNNKFFIKTEQGDGIINHQPINLAACKEKL
ncbi:MAG: hypothetical protein V1712_04045 [Patescibacteria group bacterium]